MSASASASRQRRVQLRSGGHLHRPAPRRWCATTPVARATRSLSAPYVYKHIGMHHTQLRAHFAQKKENYSHSSACPRLHKQNYVMNLVPLLAHGTTKHACYARSTAHVTKQFVGTSHKYMNPHALRCTLSTVAMQSQSPAIFSPATTHMSGCK